MTSYFQNLSFFSNFVKHKAAQELVFIKFAKQNFFCRF